MCTRLRRGLQAGQVEGKWFQVEECWGCAGIVDRVLLPRKKLHVYIDIDLCVCVGMYMYIYIYIYVYNVFLC